VERTILDDLAERFDVAIRRIADLRRQNQLLLEENQRLLMQLAEQNHLIQNLKKALETTHDLSLNEELKKYQETEEKIRKKISEMLAKLDSLRKLESR
jgi:hypothetical protein